MRVLRRIGFYISFKKVSEVATTVRFLGIDINSITLELTLPRDKLDKTLDILYRLQGRRKATKKELERVGGPSRSLC